MGAQLRRINVLLMTLVHPIHPKNSPIRKSNCYLNCVLTLLKVKHSNGFREGLAIYAIRIRIRIGIWGIPTHTRGLRLRLWARRQSSQKTTNEHIYPAFFCTPRRVCVFLFRLFPFMSSTSFILGLLGALYFTLFGFWFSVFLRSHTRNALPARCMRPSGRGSAGGSASGCERASCCGRGRWPVNMGSKTLLQPC